MLYQPKRRSEVAVDLSPLIDVVFLLLIFFMVSTTFKDSHGMDLNLPSAESESSTGSEALNLAIDASGAILIDGEPIPEDQLAERLNGLLANRDDKMVVLKVDEKVDHGTVVNIMDTAKSAGATGLTFAARPRTKPTNQ